MLISFALMLRRAISSYTLYSATQLGDKDVCAGLRRSAANYGFLVVPGRGVDLLLAQVLIIKDAVVGILQPAVLLIRQLFAQHA